MQKPNIHGYNWKTASLVRFVTMHKSRCSHSPIMSNSEVCELSNFVSMTISIGKSFRDWSYSAGMALKEGPGQRHLWPMCKGCSILSRVLLLTAVIICRKSTERFTGSWGINIKLRDLHTFERFADADVRTVDRLKNADAISGLWRLMVTVRNISGQASGFLAVEYLKSGIQIWLQFG